MEECGSLVDLVKLFIPFLSLIDKFTVDFDGGELLAVLEYPGCITEADVGFLTRTLGETAAQTNC